MGDICQNPNCSNAVTQASKYTKRKYCSVICRDIVNNSKWQGIRKDLYKKGLYKPKKKEKHLITMSNSSENIYSDYLPDDLIKELDVIYTIEQKIGYSKKEIGNKINKSESKIKFFYKKPNKVIIKKQKGLFDYIFDNWIYYKENKAKININNMNTHTFQKQFDF